MTGRTPTLVQSWTRFHNRRAFAPRCRAFCPTSLSAILRLRIVAASISPSNASHPSSRRFLIVLSSLDNVDQARTLVDPNVMDAQGSTAIDWYELSPDGRLVAVSLSRGGSEAGDVYVYDVETGRQTHEVIPRVNTGTAGGDLAWAPDGSGFYYTRHPRGEERPLEDRNFYQQLYYHRLGTETANDRYELGREFPRIAEIELEMHNTSGALLASIQNGDSGQFAHYIRSAGGVWKQFSSFDDDIVQATFGANGEVFLISRQNAPRGKILCMPCDTLDIAAARTVVSESDDTIVTSFYHSPPSMLATATRLYVNYQLGGPSEVRVFDYNGQRLDGPRQSPVSSVDGLTTLEGDDILFRSESYVAPPAYHWYQPAAKATLLTGLRTESPVDFSAVEVVREFATSKDGTRVPVNILFPPTARRDGSDPILVYGYGGFAISLTPSFDPLRHLLLANGVTYAVANLRGGSEYGEQWHRQGNLTRKQNVFDDFAAVIEHVVQRGYAARDRVAIMGGSNGGLLMGATLTQHPELVRAVVSFVGIYDMLRVELSANGSFNIPEFGSVKVPEQFRALRGYSPYHNVRDGQPYPAVLFLTGANDPRVDPMQSRKMTARLQAANGAKTPILLRTSASSGHGHGTSLDERIDQYTDVYAFLFQQLRVALAR